MLDSAYITVLKDSFLCNLPFTVSAELAYPFMLILGRHNPLIASAAAMAGSVSALILFYVVLVMLAKAMKKLLETNPQYPTVCHYINKLSPVIGILFALKQLALIPVFFFSFARIRFPKFLAILLFYKAAYYIYMVITVHPVFSS